MTMQAGKRGKASWKPAPGLLDLEPPKGFRRRFVNKEDSLNIARKKAQGWVFEDGPIEMKGVTTSQGANEYRELVSMVLPEDIAEARTQYYDDLTEQRSITPATRMKQQMPESAEFVFDVNK